MALPTYELEIAFTAPLDPSPVWTTIPNTVRSFSSDRGRSGEFESVSAGTATIAVDNRNGNLTPSNATGPWFGDLLPNKLVRLTMTSGGVDYPQFVGFIEAYEQVLDSHSQDAVCLLRCVDGFKVLNLERTPQYPDYPEEVERVLDPVWGYWRLNEPPATRVKPGGWVKKKDNKDRDKKPQRMWRKAKKQRFLASASGPEAQVIGNPGFLQADGDHPIAGEFSYGIRFDGGLTQRLRVPVAEADDRPGAENSLAVSAVFNATSGGTVIAGPLVTSLGTPAWELYFDSSTSVAFWVELASGVTVICSADSSVTYGDWYHVVATWNGADGVSRVFVNGVLEQTETTANGGFPSTGAMRRGDTGAPIYVANHPNSARSPLTGTIAEVVVSEVKPDGLFAANVAQLYQASVAGLGSPANLPLAGERIEAVLDGITAADYDPSFYTSANRDIDTGEQEVLPQRLDESKLELLRRVEEAENGLLFVALDGTLTFRDNAWFEVGAGATVQGTFKNDGIALPYTALNPSLSDDMLFPVVTVTREGGDSQTVGDTSEFFGATLELGDTLHTTDAAALDRATKDQERFGLARERVNVIEVHAGTDDRLYPHVLGRELGDRVVVEHEMPDGSTVEADCRIIGIRRDSQGVEHVAQWALAPSYFPTVAEWYLGVDGFSELQETTTLA